MTELNGRFFKSPNTIFDYTENPYQIAVLEFLLRCRNTETGACFPSYQTIATNSHMTRRQAISTMKRLLEIPLVKVVQTPYKANSYEVIIPSEPPALVNTVHHPTSEYSSPPSELSSPLLVNTVHPNKTNINKTNIKRESIHPSSDKKTYGELSNVLLTKVEYDKLVESFGGAGVKDRIKELSLAIGSKGYKYKSHYATILAWDRRDKKEHPPAQGVNVRW